MKAIDPDYQCQKYFSRGPNWAWHIDGFDKLKSYGFPIHGCIDRYSRGILVLTKETTYYEQETTWNNPKQLRHNLQWPEHTYNEQRKDVKQPTTRKISDYFTIWGKRFSSLTRFPPNNLVAVIWALLHGENEAMLHGENRVSSICYHSSGVSYHVYFLWDIRFIFFCLGFVSGKGRGYYFSSSPLPSASQIVQSSAFAFIR